MTLAAPPAELCGDAVPAGTRPGLTYAHLDHAASTPPLARVLATVNEAAAWYANVHRGAGLKSRRSTEHYETARERVAHAVRMDAASQVLLFTRNTTGALNHLARLLPVPDGQFILVTGMEHHSNDLPWRRAGEVLRVQVDAAGRVDEDHLRDLLHVYKRRIAALAVSAASNVTGIVNPVHRWARWVHEAGGRIVVDAAQYVPHRPLDCRRTGDPEHLDAVAFSGHKLYAPFGCGALVAPRDLLQAGDPAEVGGGTVDVVGDDYVLWTGLPDREEAGTPCVLGAVALAEALTALGELGWDAVEAHELAAAAVLHEHLGRVEGLTQYGDGARDPAARLPVFAFNLDGLPHGLVAGILDHEWGIGTRSGCFCAHPYVKQLLGLNAEAVRDWESRTRAGDHRGKPGLVRASLGLASSRADAARLVTALTAIAAGDHGRYSESADGTWTPAA